MEPVIAVFLFAVGVAILVGGYKLYRQLMEQAAQMAEPEPEMMPGATEVEGEVAADGLVYLFGHEFAQGKMPKPLALPRDRAFSPLTEDELDPEDWALQILYATLCDLHMQGALEFRTVERTPSFLPPFAQKRWELQAIQRMPFPSSPVMDALDVAFGLMRARKQQRVAQGKEEPSELWCSLDEIIERALKAMRQEISFWERSGVYGDLRNYVASSLVAQGYLQQPAKETWLDRRRSNRPKPNLAPIEELTPELEALKHRLAQFRLKYGSAYARGEKQPEEGQQAVHNVDPDLVVRESGFEDMPLDDCLRISIFEILVSLRQLEPSGDAGI
jgi:hypothetical protein